jgi:2-polyprenyl-3-methyl-5-hydroxy-6-metoxy-1,4-benzoquinol methylase
MNIVERMTVGHQLAQNERRPARGEDLGRPGDGAKLAITGSHARLDHAGAHMTSMKNRLVWTHRSANLTVRGSTFQKAWLSCASDKRIPPRLPVRDSVSRRQMKQFDTEFVMNGDTAKMKEAVLDGPLKQAKVKAAATYDAAADHFDDEPLGFWKRIGERAVARLALPAGASVLDVGCGTGASALPAAQAVGPNGFVVGVDLSARLLDRARTKAAMRHLTNVEFHLADMAALGFPDGHFDAVVSVFSIFFVPDNVRPGKRTTRMPAQPGSSADVSVSEIIFTNSTISSTDIANILTYFRQPLGDLIRGASVWRSRRTLLLRAEIVVPRDAWC